MVAVLAGDLQKRILHRHAVRQSAFEFVTYRFSDDEPGLAQRRGIHDVGYADAARETIENACTPGVRITAHQKRPRQCICVFRNQLMADALIVADVMHALNAELRREFTRRLVRGRTLPVRNRGAMIEHDDHALWMIEPFDVAPAPRHKHRIDEYDSVDS